MIGTNYITHQQQAIQLGCCVVLSNLHAHQPAALLYSQPLGDGRREVA